MNERRSESGSPSAGDAPALPLVLRPIAALGAAGLGAVRGLRESVLEALRTVGGLVLLAGRIFARVPHAFANPTFFITQAMELGVGSLPLVFVTSLFTGMISAMSAEYQFQNLVPLRYLGTAVTKLTLLELSPVLTALVMSGHIGSAIAGEIGTMKEKEELDAMSTLNLDPLRYLAMPRILAGVIMLPVLTTIGTFLALFGAWAVAVLALDVTSYTFITGMRLFFQPYDIFVCLTKSAIFGLLISLLGYYHGIRAGSGAKGVGEATMKSVVSSSVLILMFDFLIAYTMLM